MRRWILATIAIVGLTGCHPALWVDGAQLRNRAGNVVQLRGVNRPGMEYRCVQAEGGGYITDGDSFGLDGLTLEYADEVVRAFDAWPGINVVRIPLNERCWLGLAGQPRGEPYRAFVERLVQRLSESGRYTILDDHWPVQPVPTGQGVAPSSYTRTFWQQVAERFKGDRHVIFDLFNEPRLWCNPGSGCPGGDYFAQRDWSWKLYRDGGPYTVTNADHVGWTGRLDVVGTQDLITTIRNTGARNVIVVEGLGYGNASDGWIWAPDDPLAQMAFSIHTYPQSGANANNTAYLDGSLHAGGVEATPLVVGEFGEVVCSGAGDGFTERTIAWADGHRYSWLAWGVDHGEGCWGPSLVVNNDTMEPSIYGVKVRAALAG